MQIDIKRKRINWIYRLIVIAIIFIIMVLILDIQIRPLIINYSSSKIDEISSDIINDVVSDYLSKQIITYDSIVDIKYGENGIISSIQVNATDISRMKAEIAKEITHNLKNISDQLLLIPLGNIFGINLFSGIGPLIRMDIKPVGSLYSNFTSTFVSAGINQTKHKINLDFQIRMMSYIPGYKSIYNFETSFLILETVIVGKVPDAYTNIEDNNSDLISKINDYKAHK